MVLIKKNETFDSDRMMHITIIFCTGILAILIRIYEYILKLIPSLVEEGRFVFDDHEESLPLHRTGSKIK